MSMTEAEYLKVVQDANFDMLTEVDRICREHGLTYFLHGGTFLGAVRHGDFVPWDDDVDLTMPRKDYEAFLYWFRREADPRFRLLDYHDYPQFFDFISKIADTSVTYSHTAFGHEAYYDHRYCHPTLDLFVLDTVGRHHRLQLMKLKLLYGLALGHRPEVRYERFRGLPAKAAAWLLSTIGSCIPFRVLAAWYDHTAIRDQEEESKCLFLSNEQQHPHYWGLEYDVNWYRYPKTASIRGNEFPAPGEADAWLTFVYGNWKALPPEEARHPQHIGF